ncbi:MAG TPA: hypothetical protein VGK73_38545 [Polyangiaceae bacterium]
MSQRSNADLVDEAKNLGALLRVEVKTEGLKNPALVALVDELNAKVKALPPLPSDHKRPTVEEFVAAGYKAENYEAHIARWEIELRVKLAAEGAPPAPPLLPPPPAAPPPVDGNDVGQAGGPPQGRPLDEAPPRERPEAPPKLVDGASDGTVGGAPTVSATGPARRYPFTVKEGKAIVCRRGHLGAFSGVSAADFSDGQDELERLIRDGFVDDNRPKS